MSRVANDDIRTLQLILEVLPEYTGKRIETISKKDSAIVCTILSDFASYMRHIQPFDKSVWLKSRYLDEIARFIWRSLYESP